MSYSQFPGSLTSYTGKGTNTLHYCYGLDVSSSPNLYVAILTPQVMVLRGEDFRNKSGLESRGLLKGISALMRKDMTAGSDSASCHVR